MARDHIAAIRKRIGEIRDLSGDPESSHYEEDGLFEDTLLAISRGAKDPAKLAREALKVLKQENTRWYSK